MKKKYVNPKSSFVEMEMELSIAVVSQNPAGFNGKLDDEKTITTDEMLSRRRPRTQWDDAEDEEI